MHRGCCRCQQRKGGWSTRSAFPATSALVGSGPVEREVLAGTTGPAPLEAECVDLVLVGGGPGSDLARPNLSARRVVDLHARSLRRGRTRQRLSAPPSLAGHLYAPVGQIVGDLEVDRGELDPTHFLHQLREAGRPAAGLPAENHLECLALAGVGAVIEEEL